MREMAGMLLVLTLGACGHAPSVATTGDGCEHALPPGDYEQSLRVDGTLRQFRLHVPSSLRPGERAALVLNFHGGGGNAEQHARMTGFFEVSDREGFLLVTPDGTSTALIPAMKVWNAGHCCGPAAEERRAVDDVGFVRQLIDAIGAEACLDRKRVFATGFSNGAMLSHRLACQLSDRIAAIAPVSGVLSQQDLDVDPPKTLFPCEPSRPVPVFEIQGTADQCLRYDGGVGIGFSREQRISVPETVAGWVARNHCSAHQQITFHHGAVTCATHDQCEGGADVTLCTVDGGGHAWPSGTHYAFQKTCGGVLTHDLQASDAIWEFFSRHPMP